MMQPPLIDNLCVRILCGNVEAFALDIHHLRQAFPLNPYTNRYNCDFHNSSYNSNNINTIRSTQYVKTYTV